MTHFICISGQARHGKDTTAEIINDTLSSAGYSVLTIHYADLLKFICKTFFGWNGEKDEKGRTLLQRVGTDCIRAQDPDYWVDFVANAVRMFPNTWDFVIVPDTRFPNEIDRIADSGFPSVHLRVVRPGFDNGLTEEQNKHPSETALKDVMPDFWVENTSMDDLRARVKSVCECLIIRKNCEDCA